VKRVLLYDSAVSGNCYKVRLLFSHLGIEYERRELSVIDRSNRPEVIGDKNPALRVPTLVLDDGRTLGESNAITWYFADGTEYLPSDPFERAQVLQWLFFEQYDHEPNIAVARFWNIAGLDPGDEQRAAKRAGGARALTAIERHLAAGREYLVADRYTIADIALYAYTHVADEGGFELSGYPAIGAWLDRVASQPRYVPITA
jgi:glutathione S-transferase